MYTDVFKIDQLIFLIFFILLLTYKDKFKIGRLAVFLFSVIFAFYIFGPNFKAKFWLIDDHELFYFLDSESSPKKWSDFFRILLDQTEVGLFGVSNRYRPSYYSIRLLEVFLWKDQPILWYLLRFVILSSFVHSIVLIYRLFLPTAVALAWTITTFCFPFWADVFSRLGPGETYVALGFVILIFSTIDWNHKIFSGLWATIFQVIALLVMIGSKENMILMAAIPFLINYSSNGRTFKFKYYHGLYILPIIYSLLIVVSILTALSENPLDVNGNSARLLDRLLMIGQLLANRIFVISSILISLVTILILLKRRKMLHIKTLSAVLIFLWFLYFNITLNLFYYNGDLPQGNRYDFPCGLFFPILFVLSVYLIYREVCFQFSDINFYSFNLMLLLFASFGFSSFQINELQNVARKNAKRTQILQNSITSMRIEGEDTLGIIYARDFTEFEPTDSLLRYLKYYDRKMEIMIDVEDVKYYTVFQNNLMGYLRNLSKSGSDEKKLLPFDLKKMSLKSKCVIYHFGDLSFEPKKKYPTCKNIEEHLVKFY